MIFRNQCRNLSSLLFQIITLLTSWIDNLLTRHESEVFFQAIQHMQQEWDQTQANQAAHAIATSIGISMAPDAVPGTPNMTIESA